MAQILFLLLAGLIVYPRGGVDRAVWFAIAFWAAWCYSSQFVTGKFSPSFLYIAGTALTCSLVRLSARHFSARWPYIIVGILIVSMSMDLLYFAVSRYGAPVWQVQFQHIGAGLYYAVLISLIGHKFVKARNGKYIKNN